MKTDELKTTELQERSGVKMTSRLLLDGKEFKRLFGMSEAVNAPPLSSVGSRSLDVQLLTCEKGGGDRTEMPLHSYAACSRSEPETCDLQWSG